MRKLRDGIREFRKTRRADLLPTFEQLALGQKPDVLYIGCSDSRVAVNVFASTDPGDLFVVRNVGNMVAPCGDLGVSEGDCSEWAAIEFASVVLGVKDIVICGHSECGAILAASENHLPAQCNHLIHWVKNAKRAVDSGLSLIDFDTKLDRLNKISQANVLYQMDNLMTSKIVRDRVTSGDLKIHGWWFDIKNLEVYGFNPLNKKFNLLE